MYLDAIELPEQHLNKSETIAGLKVQFSYQNTTGVEKLQLAKNILDARKNKVDGWDNNKVIVELANYGWELQQDGSRYEAIKRFDGLANPVIIDGLHGFKAQIKRDKLILDISVGYGSFFKFTSEEVAKIYKDKAEEFNNKVNAWVDEKTGKSQDDGKQLAKTNHANQSSKDAALNYIDFLMNDPLQDDVIFNSYNELKGVRYSMKIWQQGRTQAIDAIKALKEQYASEQADGYLWSDKAANGTESDYSKNSAKSKEFFDKSGETLRKIKKQIGFLALATERLEKAKPTQIDVANAQSSNNSVLDSATNPLSEQISATKSGLEAFDLLSSLLSEKPAKQAEQSALFGDDDLNPNSPNYRYRDTGYIADSKKELAALAAEMIKKASKDGDLVRASSIDFDSIENNPREAKTLITKSNLLGKIDWQKHKDSGMKPAAAFLIDRVLFAIPKEPANDTAQARHDYAIGIETLRDRLEQCKTPDDVLRLIDDVREEWSGTVLSADESEQYKVLYADYLEKYKVYSEATKALRDAEFPLNRTLSNIDYYEQSLASAKRGKNPVGKYFKSEAEKQEMINGCIEKIAELQALKETQQKELNAHKAAHPEISEKSISPIAMVKIQA